MRGINKAAEPQSFITWKALANEDWKPSYNILANPQKRDLLGALLAEQFFRCCYCGSSINDNSSHIEHFRPQEGYALLELDYRNLHASCLRDLDPSAPLRCGHAKGSWFDEDCHVCPQEAGCEERFSYLVNGKIFASDDEDLAAKKMIEVLQLDINFLKNAREDVLSGVFDEHFINTATNDELIEIVNNWSTPNNFGIQSNMCHVVVRFALSLLNGKGEKLGRGKEAE